MVERSHPLAVVRQCQRLELPRSTYHDPRQGVSAEDLALMHPIDECHLQHPYYGSRRVRDWLEDNHDRVVNRKRCQRLMRRMGLVALYPKCNTSRRNQTHRVYPYLLRGLTIDRPNQVWAADVTTIPMAKDFLYLVALNDWHSRKGLSWRLSNTLDAEFCVEALEEALSRHGPPEIFNTDQGSQFTSEGFTAVLQARGIRISMDGKGRWMDNVFVARLWRSLKYEEVYLRAYESVANARASIERYFRFYHSERRHQSLARRTPDDVYYNFASQRTAP